MKAPFLLDGSELILSAGLQQRHCYDWINDSITGPPM